MKEKNKLIVNLINKYQKNKQIIGVGHCKFYPTCSCYAKETYKKFNFFYATLLSGYRILRCNPLNARKYDPVKLTKEEKLRIEYLNSIKTYLQDDFVDYLLNVDIKAISDSDFYAYIYDYYYLDSSHIYVKDDINDLIFNSRYILTKKVLKVNKEKIEQKEFSEYLKIAHELFTQGFIRHNVKESTLVKNSYNLVPINNLCLFEYVDELLNNERNKVVLINNLTSNEIDLSSLIDYAIIRINKKTKIKEIEDILDKDKKTIILSSSKSCIEYFHLSTISINYYSSVLDINYLYDLNIKK